MKNQDNWDSYMAMYEKGPGSIVLDMDLIKTAPIKDLPVIVITGVEFINSTKDGLPQKDEFANLHKISDDITNAISELTTMMPAGSFTYQSQRLDYTYVNDSTGIRDKLTKLYQSKYSNYKFYINIKEDAGWDAYLNFLYPNEDTQEFMKNQKILSQLQANGDNLTKPRKIDYWLYFGSTNDRDGFKKIILDKGYKVESEDTLNDKSAKPFKLHISRIDTINIQSITRTTLDLKHQAKQMNGDYDGWETAVIK